MGYHILKGKRKFSKKNQLSNFIVQKEQAENPAVPIFLEALKSK